MQNMSVFNQAVEFASENPFCLALPVIFFVAIYAFGVKIEPKVYGSFVSLICALLVSVYCSTTKYKNANKEMEVKNVKLGEDLHRIYRELKNSDETKSTSTPVSVPARTLPPTERQSEGIATPLVANGPMPSNSDDGAASIRQSMQQVPYI